MGAGCAVAVTASVGNEGQRLLNVMTTSTSLSL
jgi:hypothetical protein